MALGMTGLHFLPLCLLMNACLVSMDNKICSKFIFFLKHRQTASDLAEQTFEELHGDLSKELPETCAATSHSRVWKYEESSMKFLVTTLQRPMDTRARSVKLWVFWGDFNVRARSRRRNGLSSGVKFPSFPPFAPTRLHRLSPVYRHARSTTVFFLFKEEYLQKGYAR